MFNEKMSNDLLAYFGVSSHKELLEYVKNNPKNEKVIELKEILKLFNVSIPVGEDDE